MSIAENYELLGKSKIQARFAFNQAESVVFDEFDVIKYYIFSDKSILDVEKFVSVESIKG